MKTRAFSGIATCCALQVSWGVNSKAWESRSSHGHDVHDLDHKSSRYVGISNYQGKCTAPDFMRHILSLFV